MMTSKGLPHMSNRIATFGLLALGGAFGAALWWLRRSEHSVALRELPPRNDDAIQLRVPTRRERYLASLEHEVLSDAPPQPGDWPGVAPFDGYVDDAPLSEGPLTERRVSARPHAAAPRVHSADDCEAVDADSLAQVFLARATDSVQQ
jgi:hypothetical protein